MVDRDFLHAENGNGFYRCFLHFVVDMVTGMGEVFWSGRVGLSLMAQILEMGYL